MQYSKLPSTFTAFKRHDLQSFVHCPQRLWHVSFSNEAAHALRALGVIEAIAIREGRPVADARPFASAVGVRATECTRQAGE